MLHANYLFGVFVIIILVFALIQQATPPRELVKI